MAYIDIDIAEHLDEVSTEDLIDELASRDDFTELETIEDLIYQHHYRQLSDQQLIDAMYDLIGKPRCDTNEQN